ncbi:SRPBCC domain-containing protein [Algihabitans albus]|uniref:SRPBCC domain-containing protein n=1 Tax=Algihabitans albus TaxID=2164067 RepID=UPI000E5D9045|nr:SRPBCC domain-containing protein [Algihabitans albus]
MEEPVIEVPEVVVGVSVNLPTDTAFALFTDGIDRWWPKQNSFSRGTAREIGLTAEGGWFEISEEGETVGWGDVLAWQPPQRLLLAWQISPDTQPWSPEPDPAKASEVEVRFLPIEPGRTQVKVLHDAFARHGDGGAGMAAGMASPMGWPALLEAYRVAAEMEST